MEVDSEIKETLIYFVWRRCFVSPLGLRGDVLGSNVVNVGLVLGIALCTARMEVARGVVRRDLMLVLFLPVLMALLLWDGFLSRFDATILLLIFGGWLVQLVRSARAYSATQKSVPVSEGPEGRQSPLLKRYKAISTS